jgi:DNA polymerase V
LPVFGRGDRQCHRLLRGILRMFRLEVLDLVPAATVQGALFDRPDTPRSQARMRAVDALNRRFGRDTVSSAASGRRRAWKLRSEFISKRFTTDWDELLRV